MKIYKDGYNYCFDTDACNECAGNCCIGESGYIWVTPDEIYKISDFLDTTLDKFYEKYLKKVKYRFSLREIEYNGGHRCIFFDTDKKQCSIYSVRPAQCISFPFWEHFKTNIKEVEKECPGIVRL